MARIRRFQSFADDLTTEQAIEEIMCGPDGDPKTLERFRRYCERHGSHQNLHAFESEHYALVASGLSLADWHRFGQAQWRRGSVVAK